jgi:hypothetical protein
MQLSMFDLSKPSPPNYSYKDLMNEKIPFHAVEALLEDYLQEELSEIYLLDVLAVTDSNINSKWIMSSAMQKSIRRGAVLDSVRYALTYHAVDPVGFWNRLVLVAFEEVGVGDVWAVALTLIAARSKTFRQKIGGDVAVIQFIIQMLAKSVKDRSVADMSQILENRPQKPKTLTMLMTATDQELSDFTISELNSFNFRIASAWMLWGDRLKNCRLPLRVGNRELFEDTIGRLNVPGIVKYICLRGMVACKCGMNLTFPFVWQMMKSSEYLTVIETSFPEVNFYIKGVPDFAYDKHTLQGKAAYKYFYSSCPAANAFLTSKGIVGSDEIISAVGIAVFISESALLDRKIDFVGAEEIYNKTVEDDYKKNGLTLDDGRELSKLIQDNADILRQARIRAAAGRRA